MLNTRLYIDGKQVDLYKDENVELNSSVQNINDISKTFSDFSQSFTIPSSSNNDAIFQHYYDVDVDGTFNPNIRVLAEIQLGSLPFKNGVIQLESVRLKDLKADSYTIRFYSPIVNLTDKFGEDELSVLELPLLEHTYNATVLDSLQSDTINNGSVYYPLISSVKNYEVGTANANDITTIGGEVNFLDLKPALSISKIIEAIELKYSIEFDKEFLNRATVQQLYMWLHNEAGRNVLNSTPRLIDLNNATITTTSTNAITAVSINIVNDTVSYIIGSGDRFLTTLQIIPTVGYITVPYSVQIQRASTGEVLSEINEVIGTNIFSYESFTSETLKFIMSVSQSLEYNINVYFREALASGVSGSVRRGQSFQAIQTMNGISGVRLPKMKVKDFITSLIKCFNIVLTPITYNKFTFLPLDEWYAKGKVINLTRYIDSKDITISRPKLYKKINFKHKESKQILNDKFRKINGIGYGDLQATYDIDGSEYNIETGFENLMFEHLQNRSNNEYSKIQVGKSFDDKLTPYVGSPYIFYKGGLIFHDNIKVKNHADINYSYYTGTENDSEAISTTQSVNFSNAPSTYNFQTNGSNLFSNYYSDYINDLYSRKRRLYTLKGNLPVGLLITLKLNDLIVINDKTYTINSKKMNLTTGDVNFELLNYIGVPFSSNLDNINLTADTVNYTADTTILTADMTYINIPYNSLVNNGVEYLNKTVTPGKQKFDLKINANQFFTVSKINTGDGISWLTLEQTSGTTSRVITYEVQRYDAGITAPQFRQMELLVTIGPETYTILIKQGRE